MQLLTTPQGKAVYPYLQVPDTKFNDEGLYNVKLHVSEEDYNEFKEQIDELFKAADESELARQGKKKLTLASSSPLRITDEGDYEIYAKQEAKKMTKSKGLLQFSIAAVNAKGTKIKMPAVAGGSILKLAVAPHFWFVPSQGFGMTLRLRAVQIIELIERETASVENIFASVEGFDGGESFSEELENDAPQTEKESKGEDDEFSF